MASKSIPQLQKEIKDIERKRTEEKKRRELEEKLKRLKTPSKISPQQRIRKVLGKRVSSVLDRASGFSKF